MSTRIVRVAGCAVACLLFALPAACAPKATLQSTWPVASVEATVAAPAQVSVYPLTGLPAQDARAASLRPLCVKLLNTGLPSKLVGAQAADVVYESRNADGSTQLACLYQSALAKRMAPVTLASSPDSWIGGQYGVALFSAGVPASLGAPMAKLGILDFSADTTASSAYRQVGGATSLDGRAAEGLVVAAGAEVASEPSRLKFSATTESTNTPISRVTVPLAENRSASWAWDAAAGVYRRSENGQPVTSAPKGAQISARNVVVMWAHYTEVGGDLAPAGGYDVALGGTGQVSVFRGGQRLDGKWKADATTAPRFVAEDGSEIRLAPGNTWIEVIPLSANITLR